MNNHLAPLVVIVLAGCGGSSPPPAQPSTLATTPPPSATPDTAATPKASPPDSTGATPTGPATTASDDDSDPTESATPIPMKPLIEKGHLPKFPKATIGDKACWQGTAIVGDHKKDFDTIIDKCGAATGLVEYVKPVIGKLKSATDRRDTYTIKLLGGMCYRYFGVADGSIRDLDILVEKMNGALVADDKTQQPVAIIDSGGPWCADSDVEYQYHVEVKGDGKGAYTFGVWARPK